MQATLERLRARREQRGEGGFTLVELLIVIVILAILAAIVVFAVQNLTGQSQVASCQANYKTVETAAEAYKAQEGSYPTALTGTGAGSLMAVATDGNGPWLKDAPPVLTSGAVVPASSPYYFAIDTTTGNVGNIMVGTVATHGGTATTVSDGAGNCASA